jgi:hypothetical protein
MVFDPASLTLALQDLGSSNGSFLNGRKIDATETPLVDEGCGQQALEGPTNWLTVGGTTLRIDVVDCPPQPLPGEAPAAIWAEGETSKTNCPAKCQS